MLNSLLTKMVVLRSAYQIWDKLNVYFASNTRARVRKLKTQLKTPKQDRSINAYLDIKRVIDSLAAVDSNVSTEDHLEVILDGLPEEYDSFITSVTSRLDPYTVDDIEALLLAQEERFDKHKSLDRPFIQANTASTQWNPSAPSWSPFHGTNLRGGRGSTHHSFNKRQPQFWDSQKNSWSGVSDSSSSQPLRVQCQLCFKFGHTALHCWHMSAPVLPYFHFLKIYTLTFMSFEFFFKQLSLFVSTFIIC